MSTQPPTGWVIWITGLPASGKSTLALAIQHQLRAMEVDVVILDSDQLRTILTPDATYSDRERARFYDQVIQLAVLLSNQGINVCIAATANQRQIRDDARRQLARYYEIWVDTPLEVCRTRDPKGLYARAAASEQNRLPGLGATYEAPLNADVVVTALDESTEKVAQQIIEACQLDSLAREFAPRP